jgi:competence protein ComEC
VSDRWALALAAAVFGGALLAVDGHLPGVPLAAGLAVLAAGWLAARFGAGRRRGEGAIRAEVVCLGAALVAAALGQRSVAGLTAPLTTGPVQEEVTLVGDPVPDGRGGVRVDVRLRGRRLNGVARAAAAAALDDRLAGERVSVIGDVRPPGPAERLVRHRHLAGRLNVETVVGWRPGPSVTQFANALRRTLSRGAEVLPERQRSLLAGVTLGDDRDQPPDMTDAFRAAGLTHLLAVSGQNVAFVLVVAAPVLTRLRFGPRLAATLAVLALFALVTRAEPSVLRATAMASVAAVGAALGRPTSNLRTLGLGAAGMLLVDPLLATSLGFRLSAAGAAGIVVGAAWIAARMPGPSWLRAPLSVTLAAQAAVAPLLVASFGAVPLASLPANLLAVPAAGPLMVWGLTGGLVAGAAGGGVVAQVVHLPTRALLAWLDGVATAAARWPLGELRSAHLAALVAAGIAVVAGSGLGPRGAAATRAAGAALAATSVLAACLVIPATGERRELALGLGATLWRGGGANVLVLDGRADAGRVLEGLRAARVDRLDVVVVRTAARATGDVVDGVRQRLAVRTVVVPASVSTVPDAVSPGRATSLAIGRVHLTIRPTSDERLDVEVAPFASGRSPP